MPTSCVRCTDTESVLQVKQLNIQRNVKTRESNQLQERRAFLECISRTWLA